MCGDVLVDEAPGTDDRAASDADTGADNDVLSEPGTGLDDDFREAVDSLPERQRQVAMIRLYEDLSFAEVASICGITANNAKVNYHHAVRNIRSFLAARGIAA